jgi:hypothetical protein
VTLRTLFLETLSRAAAAATVAAAWKRMRAPLRAFGRILAVEECATELLTRLSALDVLGAVRVEARRHLQQRATLGTAHMLALRTKLDVLLGELGSRRVEVLLVKGSAFCVSGLRPHRTCKDIDLVVAESAIPSAASALAAAGFIGSGGALWPDAHQLPAFYDRDGLAVELHTRLLARRVDAAPVRWATRPIAAGVSVLEPTDWCWHTLAHDAYHHAASGSVRTALDVAALIDRFGDQIDWQVIRARVRGWPDRIEPAICSLAQLGYTVPVPVSRRARVAVACATNGREHVSRVAARDELFVFAAGKVGGLALGSPLTWADVRRGPLSQKGRGVVPSMLQDAARLAAILLGREVADD